MTWDPKAQQGLESAKIASVAVPYLQGRFLDVGCGESKVWPSAIGIDSWKVYGKGNADVKSDGTDLSMFADGSMDAVFSSHFLEDLPREDVPTVLAEWTRVLKTGGNLVLYVPSANLYPKCGEPHANKDHKWDIYPGDIEGILRDMPGVGWELLESEERGGTNEYSLFIVARKREDGWIENVWQRNPDGKKRALVIRYGAMGDAIVASSVLPGLKKQGYYVTFNCKPSTYEVLKHDPNVDEWLLQEDNYVPNPALGMYWDFQKERYDHVVNLCESVEGAILTLPGRLQHQYPDASRRRLLSHINYFERTHDIADVPYDFAAKFYPSEDEMKLARATRRQMSGPVIVWTINGSSAHKVYPWTHIVCAWLLERTPAHIVIYADPKIGKELQDNLLIAELKKNGADMSRVHPIAGLWDVRRSLAFAQVADCMVGPETGPLNAVSMEPMPKVIYLSHSSADNLTKHWVNTTTLVPDTAKAPCYPCHRLHSTWEHCFQHEKTNAALCASSISPETIFEAIALSIGARKAA